MTLHHQQHIIFAFTLLLSLYVSFKVVVGVCVDGCGQYGQCSNLNECVCSPGYYNDAQFQQAFQQDFVQQLIDVSEGGSSDNAINAFKLADDNATFVYGQEDSRMVLYNWNSKMLFDEREPTLTPQLQNTQQFYVGRKLISSWFTRNKYLDWVISLVNTNGNSKASFISGWLVRFTYNFFIGNVLDLFLGMGYWETPDSQFETTQIQIQSATFPETLAEDVTTFKFTPIHTPQACFVDDGNCIRHQEMQVQASETNSRLAKYTVFTSWGGQKVFDPVHVSQNLNVYEQVGLLDFANYDLKYDSANLTSCALGNGYIARHTSFNMKTNVEKYDATNRIYMTLCQFPDDLEHCLGYTSFKISDFMDYCEGGESLGWLRSNVKTLKPAINNQEFKQMSLEAQYLPYSNNSDTLICYQLESVASSGIQCISDKNSLVIRFQDLPTFTLGFVCPLKFFLDGKWLSIGTSTGQIYMYNMEEAYNTLLEVSDNILISSKFKIGSEGEVDAAISSLDIVSDDGASRLLVQWTNMQQDRFFVAPMKGRCQGGEGPQCFGKFQFNDDICSSHGECVDNDQCQCFQGYSGNECQNSPSDWQCFGVDASSPNVCSSNGECVAADQCVCSSTIWKGEKCGQLEQDYLIQVQSSSVSISQARKQRARKRQRKL